MIVGSTIAVQVDQGERLFGALDEFGVLTAARARARTKVAVLPKLAGGDGYVQTRAAGTSCSRGRG